MRNIILIIGVIILVVALAFFAFNTLRGGSLFPGFGIGTQSTAIIKDQTFKLDIADDAKEQEIGLSGRNSLNKDTGMLFQFKTAGYPSFWMKNMKFPIDMLFIRDNKIVTIYHEVQPPTSPEENLPIYTPKVPADSVLEISAGLSKEYNIQEGDEIIINR